VEADFLAAAEAEAEEGVGKMVISSPGAIVFDLGFWQIRWYGILIASAILLSYFISSRWLRNAGFKESHVDGSFLLVVAFGLIGARAGSVLQLLTFFKHDWWGVFRVWDGGLSIHGAIIGGILAILAAQRIYKFNFLKFADAISPQVLLSVAIGRWGNFFNEEISGRPYSGFLKLFISPENRLSGFKNIAYYHPVFLYESVLLALSYALFLIMRARFGFKSGFFYTLIAYNAIRFFVEFWRIDYKPIVWRFDLAQIVSFGIILLGIVASLVLRINNRVRAN
jgi:phosphatidylglycerol:prolipoprotein diacylglycerol transferase